MKKFITALISLLFAVLLIALTLIMAIQKYYDDTFQSGIWINSLYCTGMTAEEVSRLLDEDFEYRSVTVKVLSGDEYTFVPDKESVTASYEPGVKEILNKTRRDTFGFGMLPDKKRRYMIEPELSFDTEGLKTWLCSQSWLNENLYDTDRKVEIVKSVSDGYILIDDTKDMLLRDEAASLIADCIADNLYYIDLSTEENKKICYASMPYTADMESMLSKWESIKEFQDFSMVYEFGDAAEILDAGTVADWMALDENGNILFDDNNYPVLDIEVLKEYIAYLSTKYNTVGAQRKFRTTHGDTVSVSGGLYGNELDETAEYDFLLDAFIKHKSGTRIPQYVSEARKKGTDDIGDTYIEIDIRDQMMYYYEGGRLMISTPVVTGNEARRWNTRSKVCYVYYKQKNRVLRGANYATPVKFWMAVDGNIGIHDATWRKEFGGDIYKTNGSHGCINTPLDIMEELYDMAELGTPVIIID